MAADRIRLTDTPPPRCSACFQAQPWLAHVDFGADYDGPMLPNLPEENIVGGKGVAIDELILCATCVATAAALFGFVVPDAVAAERDLLKHGNETLVAKVQARDAYIAELEKAVTAKQQLVLVPERPDLDAPSAIAATAPAQPPPARRRRRPASRPKGTSA